MSPAPFAILDPAAGISGDMLLGAFADLGVPADWLGRLPARLGFPDVRVEVTQVLRCGISCRKVSVTLPGGATEPPSPDFVAPHHHGHDQLHHDHSHATHHGGASGGHAHHGEGTHRHLADLLAIIERAPISGWVRERAARAFQLLCEQEGRIHGLPTEAVALHEVGAVDAIIDIVGAIEACEYLGVRQVYARPVSLGSGWVHAAHGVMSVPAPVTTRLLEGIEIGPNGPVTGEATTPTGAVLLRVLSAGPPPLRWRALATGWGAGSRDPSDYPNALRIILAESSAEAASVETLSTDVDDLSPEYIEPLREALVAAGALDVQVWATQMKKGRPGFRIEVTCDTAVADRVTEAFFLHSTTAGVRRVTAERVTLARTQLEVSTSDGHPIRVKVLATPAGPRVKAEYDDIRAAATRLGRPAHDVAREIEAEARQLVAGMAAGVSHPLREQG
ncbi:MAG: nickel pincer cofactor biosynthesis protein LarC [Gemmatimonadota bacterium]|nr:nickel pincer cofactor biosynthesis protein LarC [Gemmatimonadota bacterium]